MLWGVMLVICMWPPTSSYAQSSKKRPPSPVQEEASSSTIALIEAATSSDLDKVQTLLTQGANVNGKDLKGTPSLIAAAKQCQPQTVDIVKLLLSRGADVNARDVKGKSALAWALEGLCYAYDPTDQRFTKQEQRINLDLVEILSPLALIPTIATMPGEQPYLKRRSKATDRSLCKPCLRKERT